MPTKITPQMLKDKNISIANKEKIIKEQKLEKEKLQLRIQELEEKLNKINNKNKINSLKIQRIKEEIRIKNKTTTKQITMRIKIETLEKLQLEEKMYQRLINKILDAWVEY